MKKLHPVITYRKIEGSRERYRILFNGTPVGMIMRVPEGRNAIRVFFEYHTTENSRYHIKNCRIMTDHFKDYKTFSDAKAHIEENFEDIISAYEELL